VLDTVLLLLYAPPWVAYGCSSSIIIGTQPRAADGRAGGYALDAGRVVTRPSLQTSIPEVRSTQSPKRTSQR
jgi:hypothetical protein